jgi:exonuclease VII large subunit
MTRAIRDIGDSGQGEGGSPRHTGPSQRQEDILVAYVDNPNAAAVGRALRTNERHVRRLLKRFEDRLEELRHERNRERIQRTYARETKVDDWADASLDESLSRLDSLAASTNESVALRAIREKLKLALRAPQVMSKTGPSEIDLALQAKERDLARRISEIEIDAADEETDRG